MSSRARSAIVVTVKPTLLSWMKNNGFQRPYFPEEDAVWVIPAVSSFSEPGAFELYVDALRPRILDAELERFGHGLRERILADHALEGLIDLTVRDEVVFADGDE